MTAFKFKPTLALAIAATIPLSQKAWGQSVTVEGELENSDEINAFAPATEIEEETATIAEPSTPISSPEPEFAVVPEPLIQVERTPEPEVEELESSSSEEEGKFTSVSTEQTLEAEVKILEQKATNKAEPSMPASLEEPEFSSVESLPEYPNYAKSAADLQRQIPEEKAIENCTKTGQGNCAEQAQKSEVAVLETSQLIEEVTQDSNENNPLIPREIPSLVPATTQEEIPEIPAVENEEFQLSPRVIPNERITPAITSLSLNNVPISHLTEWEASATDTFGDNINNQFSVNGTVRLNSQISESLTQDNVYTIEQNGHYLQLQTATQSREIETSVVEPQTLLGFQIQMSLTAPCRLPNTDPSQQCTYTPGLITDRESIDPDTLLPTRVLQPSRLGDEVTAESLAAIQQPGFQMGANGQQVGIDLFFPNAGTIDGNEQSSSTSVRREETVDNTPVPIYASVRQIVRANDREAVLGRTIRGVPFVVGDKNTLLNSALQLSNFLPDAEPTLEGSENPVNTNVNRNLFLAANNTRLPANSFTVYQAGIGRAETPEADITDIRETPAANFNSLWLGISPITERSFSTTNRFEVTGPRRTIAEGGGEGGVNSDVSFLSLVNGQEFSTQNLPNFYTQVYLKFFNTDVNSITGSRLREETNYYPHLSFTGNVTGTEDIFRYYAGAIAGNNIKAYLGADYTKTTQNGWSFAAGGIGYLNPDRDYYSQLQGSVAKRITLGDNANLVLSGSANYALDRETTIGETVIIDPASSLSVGARANVGPISAGVAGFFGGILPNSVGNTLVTDLAVNVGDRARISGYYTPINNSSSRSRYGVKADVKLGDDYNSPTLSLGWANQQYGFGNDPSGSEIVQNDNVFTIQMRFGSPRNPFSLPNPTP
ncbi:hypothetical protein IQ249_03650 [Lusitaniella coriacea LEGE 07157]|uniref:Uncharacterized protein n=1 Tax=Lusitaniella coriacea LEGE 07157 TaxID=945747 RepID=A0A8J7AWW0_9CYAN|nr:hypothetical protein [Lusitaniella coriacea]MBE9114987.1 hypothetical protein [Lusitaniella coriacea LEGE 07157]